MNGEVIYRNWRPGDEEGIVKLLPKEWCQGCACYMGKPGGSLKPENIFLAVWEGKIVGHAIGRVDPVFVEGEVKRFGWIETVIVAPEMRGRGIGSELIRRAIRYLEGEGCRGILLTAKRGSPAHRMYEKLGFRDLAVGIFTLLRPMKGDSKVKLTPAEPSDVDEMRKLKDRWMRRVFPVIHHPFDLPVDKLPPRIVSTILSKHRVFRRGDEVVGYTRWSRAREYPGVRDPVAVGEDVEEMVRAVRTSVETPVFWHTTAGSRYEAYLRSLGCQFELDDEVIMLRPIGRDIDLGDMEVTYWGIYW